MRLALAIIAAWVVLDCGMDQVLGSTFSVLENDLWGQIAWAAGGFG
jgi:hypothetical protein